MTYLLDTSVWLWSVSEPERIAKKGLEILQGGQEEIYLSAATSWEVSIKARSGKLNLPGRPDEYIASRTAQQGLRLLPITHLHTWRTNDLPLHHADPFDRLIIAQAILEKMTVLTSDRTFEKYPVEMIWCGK